jgi:hypothetical protein
MTHYSPGNRSLIPDAVAVIAPYLPLSARQQSYFRCGKRTLGIAENCTIASSTANFRLQIGI